MCLENGSDWKATHMVILRRREYQRYAQNPTYRPPAQNAKHLSAAFLTMMNRTKNKSTKTQTLLFTTVVIACLVQLSSCASMVVEMLPGHHECYTTRIPNDQKSMIRCARSCIYFYIIFVVVLLFCCCGLYMYISLSVSLACWSDLFVVVFTCCFTWTLSPSPSLLLYTPPTLLFAPM